MERRSKERSQIGQAERGSPGTRLTGTRLLFARAIWLAITLLQLVLFAAAVPLEYRAHLASGLNEFAPALEIYEVSPQFFATYRTAMNLGLVLAFTLLGVLVVRMRSDDWMAMLVSLASITFGVLFVPTLIFLNEAYPQVTGLVGLVRAIGLASSLIGFFYLFPDGRPVPRWTGLLGRAWIALCLVWLFFPHTPFNLVYLRSWWGSLALSFAVLLLWFGTGAAAQLYRYHRVSGPMEKQQTKWVVFGSTAGLMGFVSYYLPLVLAPSLQRAGTARLMQIFFGIPIFHLLVLLAPLCIGLAILRYNLWEIDLLINRSLVYGMLSVSLLVVYLGSVIFLEAVVSFFAGGLFQESQLIIVLSTLLISILFMPLRQRLQVWIDRRFYRHQYDAAQLITGFSENMRREVDLNRMSERLIELVDETVKPEHVSLWMQDRGR